MKTTLQATPLHFCCFAAKDDDQCQKMMKVLVKKPEDVIQFVNQKNADGITAVCRAAERSFEESVKYIGLCKCSEENKCCDIELEYGVRSNNETILQYIFEKHEKCPSQVNRIKNN
jgi:hypothetical protein